MKKTIAIIGILFLMSFHTEINEKRYKFEFTVDEVQIIYDALGELPAKKTESIRYKLLKQVNDQNINDNKK